MNDLLDVPKLSVRLVLGLVAVAFFWMAVVAWWRDVEPLAQTQDALHWLGVDVSWPETCAAWVANRADAVSVVASLMLIGGICGVIADEPRSVMGDAPGALTALGSAALARQAGSGTATVVVCVVLGMCVGLGLARPRDVSIVEAAASAAAELFTAALAPVLLLLYFFRYPTPTRSPAS